MKFAAFDLEIAKPVEGDDWKGQRPLGISCAAVLPDGMEPYFWTGKPQLSQSGVKSSVKMLYWLIEKGYTVVTWNGAAFDFDILAEESGEHEACAQLAMNHVDLMAIVVATQGHYLGLDKAAVGCGVESKLKSVTLKDGSTHEAMNGAAAPELWQAGETEAVIEYLKQDVRTTLAVAQNWAETMSFAWTTGSGRFKREYIPGVWGGDLPTVEQLLNWKGRHAVDTSWMSSPPDLDVMLSWTGWGVHIFEG